MATIRKTLDIIFFFRKTKNCFFRYVPVFIFTLFYLYDTSAQQLQQDPGNYALPQTSGERISVFTDRTLYIVGEKIWLTVDYRTNSAIYQLEWSTAIYVELIRWNGDQIVKSKLNLNRSGASGFIIIPEEVVSGNYYVRAYTRWMRNYGPCDYGYSRVKILNPYRKETDEGPLPDNPDSAGSIDAFAAKKWINGIACKLSKNTYGQREKVDVNLYLNKELKNPPVKYALTITEKGGIDTSRTWPLCISDKVNRNKIFYYPEIRGVSVSGDVINRKTNEPLGNTVVYLSIPVSGEFFSTYTTGVKGRFLFTLPELKGNFDFYIEVLTGDTIDAVIRIDNDFCKVPLKLPYIPFELDPAEKLLVQNMMINFQLKEKYIQNTESKQSGVKSAKSAVFYGKPENVIFTGDYIELNNLQEFIYELIKPIIVYHKNDLPDIRFNLDIGLPEFSPLVLIDNLPVTNIQQVLNIPVTKLERIEYINQGYVAGDKVFKGLLSIYSKKSDFAGIEISKKGMFFNYQVYAESNISNPVYYNEQAFPKIPDLRNTLFWKPDISLVPGEEKTLTFYTSDSKGDFVVFVQGLADNGLTEVYGTCTFRVE